MDLDNFYTFNEDYYGCIDYEDFIVNTKTNDNIKVSRSGENSCLITNNCNPDQAYAGFVHNCQPFCEQFFNIGSFMLQDEDGQQYTKSRFMYYEIEVVSLGNQTSQCCIKNSYIAVGLATTLPRRNRAVGWGRHEFGYHADNGGIYNGNDNSNLGYFDAIQENDKVGIGFLEDRIVVTKNGKLIYSEKLKARTLKRHVYYSAFAS